MHITPDNHIEGIHLFHAHAEKRVCQWAIRAARATDLTEWLEASLEQGVWEKRADSLWQYLLENDNPIDTDNGEV